MLKIRINNFRNFLNKSQFFLLLLLILTLPSFEAPKNIFLVLFLIVGFFRQFYVKDLHFLTSWDWVFFCLFCSAFLTTLFPGMHVAEWKGFTIFLTSILIGWVILRSKFTNKEISSLYSFIIYGTVPPLIVGLVRYIYLQDKPDLQLHSVGHVNHSAIYLTIILGASIGSLISFWKKNNAYQNSLLVILNALFFISLIISQSRAAVGMGIFLSILLFLILSKSMKFKISGILTVLIITAISIILNVGVVQKEIRNEKANDILGSRDKVWNISFEAAKWSPILGIGMNNWGKIKPDDIKSSVEKRGEIYNEKNYSFQGHSHSIYLTSLVERGILGFLILILFMTSWLFFLIKKFKISIADHRGACLWAGSFSAWLVTFGIGFFNTTFHHEHGILSCILLGLHISYMSFNKKNYK
jgi:O-antigen ligase